MNARDIAVAKAKAKTEVEKVAEQNAIEEREARVKKGARLAGIVKAVVHQFDKDFHVTHVEGKYAWKFTLKEKDRKNVWRGPWQRTKEFFVVLEHHTYMARFCDECDEQQVSKWAVSVEVPPPFVYCGIMRDGNYNRTLDRNTVQDFYCSKIEKEFEKEFGEYMVRWYEHD